jgi:hypothetical protein
MDRDTIERTSTAMDVAFARAVPDILSQVDRRMANGSGTHRLSPRPNRQEVRSSPRADRGSKQTQGKSRRRDSCWGHTLAEMGLGARFPGPPQILGMNAKRPDRNS